MTVRDTIDMGQEVAADTSILSINGPKVGVPFVLMTASTLVVQNELLTS